MTSFTNVGMNIVKFVIRYENFEAKQGDALKSETFEDHVENCDAVMSCLGATGSRFATMTFYNDALKEMHKAMEKWVDCLLHILDNLFCTSYNLQISFCKCTIQLARKQQYTLGCLIHGGS